MKATVKVVAKSKSVPSSKADKVAVAKQLASTLVEVKKNNRRANAAGNVVEAGRDTNKTSLLAFFPTTKTVPAGTTVEFQMSSHTNEIHTVTFGSDAVFAKGGYAEKQENALLSPLPGTGTNGPPELGFPGPVVLPERPGGAVVRRHPARRVREFRADRREAAADEHEVHVPEGRDLQLHVPDPPRDEGQDRRPVTWGDVGAVLLEDDPDVVTPDD